jgi:hypothetical protein
MLPAGEPLARLHRVFGTEGVCWSRRAYRVQRGDGWRPQLPTFLVTVLKQPKAAPGSPPRCGKPDPLVRLLSWRPIWTHDLKLLGYVFGGAAENWSEA